VEFVAERWGRASFFHRLKWNVFQVDLAHKSAISAFDDDAKIALHAIIPREVGGHFPTFSAGGLIVGKLFALVLGDLATIFKTEEIPGHFAPVLWNACHAPLLAMPNVFDRSYVWHRACCRVGAPAEGSERSDTFAKIGR
jgi:hypothetical protein